MECAEYASPTSPCATSSILTLYCIPPYNQHLGCQIRYDTIRYDTHFCLPPSLRLQTFLNLPILHPPSAILTRRRPASAPPFVPLRVPAAIQTCLASIHLEVESVEGSEKMSVFPLLLQHLFCPYETCTSLSYTTLVLSIMYQRKR